MVLRAGAHGQGQPPPAAGAAPLRLVFAGTPAVALPSLEALLASTHDLVAVVTRPDAPAGRGRRLTPSPVADRAAAAGLEVLTPARPRDAGFLARLAELAPDCAPVVAYGALVPPAALAVPSHGWVNLHFSLLPAWRGAAPVQHALLHGDQLTGASTFALEEGLDTGPVYGMLTEPIQRDDTAGDLLERLSRSGARLLLATLDGIASGELHPVPQAGEGISHAPKLTPEQARLDWTTPAWHVDRLARAATPAPGAWTTFRGDRLGLGPVRPLDEALAPGRLLDRGRSGVLVGTGTTAVRLGQVHPPGRARMPATDWVRGARLTAADRLG